MDFKSKKGLYEFLTVEYWFFLLPPIFCKNGELLHLILEGKKVIVSVFPVIPEG